MKKSVTPVTCDADYVVLCDVSLEALSTRAVLMFFRPELSSIRVYIFGNNECSKVIADNLNSTLTSKHINVKLPSGGGSWNTFG